MNGSYTDPAVAAFVVIPALLTVALTWGTAAAWRRSGARRRTTARVSLSAFAGAWIWMLAIWVVADNGVLRNWNRTPPPFAILIAVVAAVAAGIAFSDFGSRLARFLPLWTLVGVQAFRLPLELAMHVMHTRGVVPEQMSYTGRNFDIVTGITAIIVSALVATGRGGRRLVTTWNVVGLALLLNILVIAVLSTPTFRWFGDDRLNVWVTYPPFVWLPAVMVLAALAGHLLIFRALRWPPADSSHGYSAFDIGVARV